MNKVKEIMKRILNVKLLLGMLLFSMATSAWADVLFLPDPDDWFYDRTLPRHERMSSRQMMETLKKKGVVCGKKVDAIEDFLQEENWEKMFNFDIFNDEITTKDRTPSGVYDKLVGYEFMYAFLNCIEIERFPDGVFSTRFPKEPDEMSYFPFVPQTKIAKQTFKNVSCFLDSLNNDTHLWFYKLFDRDLKKFINHCEVIHESYFRVIQKCLELAEKYKRNDGKKQINENSRRRILALAIATYLGKGWYFQIENSYNRVLFDLVLEYDMLRRETDRLKKDYNKATAEDKIKIREKVLSIGFPGNPFVEEMWKERIKEEQDKKHGKSEKTNYENTKTNKDRK